MKQGRITIRISDVNKITVVAYPKTKANQEYAKLMEYIFKLKSTQELIKEEMNRRLFQIPIVK